MEEKKSEESPELTSVPPTSLVSSPTSSPNLSMDGPSKWATINDKYELISEESPSEESPPEVKAELKEQEKEESEEDKEDKEEYEVECPQCNATATISSADTSFSCPICKIHVEIESSNSESEEVEESDDEEVDEAKQCTMEEIPSFIMKSTRFLLYVYVVKFLLYLVDGGNYHHTCHCMCKY